MKPALVPYAAVGLFLIAGIWLNHSAPPASAQFTPPALPRTYGDISTPGVNPVAGNTTVYTKSGTVCALSPTGAETCTGSGGGGGNTTSSTAIGSEPGSPTTGDLDFYSNAPFIARWSGSAWIRWLAFPISAWSETGFGWQNQGGATATLTSGVLNLTAPASGTNSLRIRVKNAPGGSYTATVLLFKGNATSSSGFQEMGMLWMDTAGGGIETCAAQMNGATSTIVGGDWTNSTSFSGVIGGLVNPNSPGAWLWLQEVDDGVNRTCSFSQDGQAFTQAWQHSRTTFITPTSYGIYANSANSVVAVAQFVSGTLP